jgi:hypothetical protein
MCRYSNIWWLVKCSIGQVIGPTFGDMLTLVNCNIKKNKTFVYNFIVCCLGETVRCHAVQRHFCWKKRGNNSTTNRVLKIYWPCIEYSRFLRVHFKPMIFLECHHLASVFRICHLSVTPSIVVSCLLLSSSSVSAVHCYSPMSSTVICKLHSSSLIQLGMNIHWA